MAEPSFPAIVAAVGDRLELIRIADGYFSDIGSTAQIRVGLGVADPGTPAGETVIIEAAREVGFDDTGAQRQGVVALEQRPSRDILVSVVVKYSDRDQWLLESERIASDVRRALFSDGPSWRQLGVVRFEQTDQDSGWPQVGSGLLVIQLTFRVTYIER